MKKKNPDRTCDRRCEQRDEARSLRSLKVRIFALCVVAAVDRGFLQNMHIAVVIMFCRAHAHCSSHTTSAPPIFLIAL